MNVFPWPKILLVIWTLEESSKTSGENERILRSSRTTWQTNEANEPREAVVGAERDSFGAKEWASLMVP